MSHDASEPYTEITRVILDAGFYVSPPHADESFSRICPASKRREGGGYTGSLAFRDFMGHGNAKCMIRTPNHKFWADAKTSIPATTTKQLQDDLNRQMEKLQQRLAKQNEIKNNKEPQQTSK